MHIDSTVLILFGIALTCFILVKLMESKKFGDKAIDIFLLVFSFVIGSILLPLGLGIILLLSEIAYFLNNNVRENNPYIFWGASVLIGIVFAYWNYKKRTK